MKTNRNQANVNAAFKAGVKTVRANGGKLTQEKSATIAIAAVGALFKDDGTSLVLTSPQKDVLKAMFYPNIDLRMRVLTATLEDAGCTLDDTTAELLKGLLTPANLEKKLATALTKAPAVDWSEMVEEEQEDDSASVDDQEVTQEESANEKAPATAPDSKAVTPQQAQVKSQKAAAVAK